MWTERWLGHACHLGSQCSLGEANSFKGVERFTRCKRAFGKEEMGLEWKLDRMWGEQKGGGHTSEASPGEPLNSQSLSTGVTPRTGRPQACGGGWEATFPAC